MHLDHIVTGGQPFATATNALVMLHGRGSNAQDILSLAQYLNMADFALLTPQAPGHSWQAATDGPLKGVPDVLEEPWASSQIVADPHSAIVDLTLTAKEGKLLSVAAWYDNEWSFSSRLAEVAAFLTNHIH